MKLIAFILMLAAQLVQAQTTPVPMTIKGLPFPGAKLAEMRAKLAISTCTSTPDAEHWDRVCFIAKGRKHTFAASELHDAAFMVFEDRVVAAVMQFSRSTAWGELQSAMDDAYGADAECEKLEVCRWTGSNGARVRLSFDGPLLQLFFTSSPSTAQETRAAQVRASQKSKVKKDM